MESTDDQRRQFLNWLAASPLLALPLGHEVFAEDPKEALKNFTKRPDPMVWPSTTFWIYGVWH